MGLVMRTVLKDSGPVPVGSIGTTRVPVGVGFGRLPFGSGNGASLATAKGLRG